jgi:hypothetical protein
MGKRRRGASYRKRVADINRIYGEYVNSGLSNREIWLRYIYPVYAISERTFYNILKAPAPSRRETIDYPRLFDDGDD